MRLTRTLEWTFLASGCLVAAGRSTLVEAPGLCLASCQNTFQSVFFRGSDPARFGYAEACEGEIYLQSLYLCLRTYCSASAALDGLHTLNQTCRDTYAQPLLPLSIVANYTDRDVSDLRTINATESWDVDHPLDEVVLPETDFFSRWFQTLDAWAYVQKYHFRYGLAMTLFWSAVVAVGISNHFLLLPLVRNYMGKTSTSFNSMFNVVSTSFHGNLAIPATFGRRRAENIGWCTIPPRIQSATIVVFLAINVVFSVCGYRLTQGNLYFPTTEKQVMRYVSDRTGIISFACFPVIWLFGMRNNVALWLTGWDFATYTNFHRWSARIATLQAVIHSLGYTALIFREGGWTYFATWWAKWFWWAGELATVIMCAILVFSVFWLRRQRYELFLVIHIALSVLLLLFMLGHVSIFNGKYDGLFWIPVCIWVLDRVIRLVRLSFFNWKSLTVNGYATYNHSANIVRLKIPLSTSAYTPQPGTFYYLMVLDGSNGWESHPFTVSSVCSGDAASLKSLGEQVPLLDSDDEYTEATEDNLRNCGSSSSFMTFLIRPYDSFTKRMRDRSEGKWPKAATLRMCVEGPYGHTQQLSRFDHVVFIVGGSGIVLPLSYLGQLLSNDAHTTQVEIHWALREPEFAEQVIREDISHYAEADSLRLNTYLRPHVDLRIDPSVPDWVQQHPRGLDVGTAIAFSINNASEKRIAIVSCGPARMADEARRAVATLIQRRQCYVEYFEEGFSW